jgi:hypothetical protein
MDVSQASLLLLQRASGFVSRRILRSVLVLLAVASVAGPLHAQLIAEAAVPAALADAPDPQGATQKGSITGTVLDIDGLLVPGALITANGPNPEDKRTAISGQDGRFTVTGIRPAVEYNVVISLKLFADYTPPTIVLGPGQVYRLEDIKLKLAPVAINIEAKTPEALAIEQEHVETQQRLFGILPNFYVVYDHSFAPLTPQLKYQLAFKASFDVVNGAAALFLGAINQAAHRPDYREGLIGYGERVGAVYVDGVTDIVFGGAVLPSLLHQDPRYFYEGRNSTKKKRFYHAIEAPFVCKGDNGKNQFNYSSIGGDLISGALSNVYYPPHDRGLGLVLSTAAIATGGRMVNALAQEFLLSKFTTHGKGN